MIQTTYVVAGSFEADLGVANEEAAEDLVTGDLADDFIEALLQPALAKPETARFFDTDVLARFRGTGGVRLEDVVAITASGIDNYTLCPRTIPEVEAVMSGGKWPPAVDEAPWMERRWFTLDRMSGVMVEDRSVKL